MGRIRLPHLPRLGEVLGISLSLGDLSDQEFAQRHGGSSTHPAGCTYGGFSCGFWLISDGCPLEHWERHVVRNDLCPCGTRYPDAGTTIVFFDATEGESDG